MHAICLHWTMLISMNIAYVSYTRFIGFLYPIREYRQHVTCGLWTAIIFKCQPIISKNVDNNTPTALVLHHFTFTFTSAFTEFALFLWCGLILTSLAKESGWVFSAHAIFGQNSHKHTHLLHHCIYCTPFASIHTSKHGTSQSWHPAMRHLDIALLFSHSTPIFHQPLPHGTQPWHQGMPQKTQTGHPVMAPIHIATAICGKRAMDLIK